MKSLLSVFALLWVSSLSLSAQMLVSVNNTITQDTLLTTIQGNSISSKTIIASGQVVFSSKSGYVRILLSDDYGYDLLMYESSPLVAVNGIDNFSSVAMETVNIPSHLALTKVRVEIKNAELRNLSVDVSAVTQQQEKNDRIALINNNLRNQNALWVAGETPVSQMSFEEKKGLFGGSVPDLQGVEYYVGGIFEIMEENGMQPNRTTTTSRTSTMISKFDWRNRHGRNWNTSVKNQNPCGTCWAYGAIGAVEGLVNLYYNRKIDLDLSEQQIISCTGSTCNSGGWSGTALDYIITNGVVNETCFPNGYASNPPCSDKCSNPAENIKIAGKQIFYSSSYPDPVTELKKRIIQKGVIGGRIGAWAHAMTLVGFGTVQAGDVVYIGTSGGYNISITIGADDPRIGETYWIFKNSWGSSWGSDGGYLYVISDINQLSSSVIPLSPITSHNYTNADIVCEDRDSDGYYFWGIGPKPAHCPSCAPDEPDGDDSNPYLGPMDEYGNCEAITPLSENITTSQTWNTNRTVCKNLVIQSGATLTITATVFVQAHKITIQNGGKIILSGGTIDDGNIIAQSGSELTITNNGKILLGSYDNLDIQLGAIFDNTYGEILLK
ncbi:MAG: C1 family peptidase [Dysgonamonadaceae bacterium]|jgi:C1A family cysteine protease|nr:C1 family peptidase [Dysgonamonadaceae bacterium]